MDPAVRNVITHQGMNILVISEFSSMLDQVIAMGKAAQLSMFGLLRVAHVVLAILIVLTI
jgi:hypothetical protein